MRKIMPVCAFTLLLLAFSISGCAQNTAALTSASTTVSLAAAQMNASLAQAQSNLATVTQIYGISKGIAIVASQVNPAVGPIMAQATAIGDPLLAKAQSLVNDTAIDVNTVNQLVAQLQQQANTLGVAGAPSVTAIPNVPAK